ncbi:hypothetical protein Pcinc_006450 [Petrolisthes cinctipes]|uniref:Peptidase M14 domain-containing protein n=1 Tax=Petrolisthes cinctipes TaxID=88211 RepID=A0AAE1GBI5_PETCI|nr:hypothetical protein Pcinc_006450 [Petrolisthes cinctipes]
MRPQQQQQQKVPTQHLPLAPPPFPNLPSPPPHPTFPHLANPLPSSARSGRGQKKPFLPALSLIVSIQAAVYAGTQHNATHTRPQGRRHLSHAFTSSRLHHTTQHTFRSQDVAPFIRVHKQLSTPHNTHSTPRRRNSHTRSPTHHLSLLWVVKAPAHHVVVRSLEEGGLLDVWGNAGPHAKVLVEEDARERVTRALKEAQLEHSVEVEDLLSLVDQERQHMRHKRSIRSSPTVQPMDWTTYHDLDDIEGFIGWLNVTGASFVQVATAATTQEGNAVRVVRITDPNAVGPKKKIWIEGGIHAREWISPAVTTYLMHQLITNPAWREMLQVTDWYMVPVANPDGYQYSFTSPRARMWRKNRRDNGSNDRCKGVDLNRNWDLKWGVGASANPCSETYKGPQAFSEPETRGLQLLMSGVRDIDLFITFHSFGQTILYPWGWTREPPANARQLKRMARQFAAAVKDASQGRSDYEIGGSGPLYGLASGATDDWAYGMLGVPFSYTIELPDQGTHGFLLPESRISSTVMETAAGVHCMIGFSSGFRVSQGGSGDKISVRGGGQAHHMGK